MYLKSITKTAYISLLTLLLISCGGGGTSESTGAGQGAPTVFAGNYEGEYNYTQNGESFNGPLNFSVSENGRVTVQNNSSDLVACPALTSQTNPFLTGNRWTSKASGRCFLERFDNCTVTTNTDLLFSANSAIGTLAINATCENTSTNLTYNITASRS